MRRLVLSFPDATRFQVEFERNISAGGAFVETSDSYELREVVEVHLDLAFASDTLVVEAEVVSAASGGVALQFLVPATTLRERLHRHLGAAGAKSAPPARAARRPAAPPPRDAMDVDPGAIDPSALEEPPSQADPLRGVGDRRRASRAPVRVPVRLDAKHVELTGITRDLSSTGALVSTDGNELPIGKEVDLEFENPDTGQLVEVTGRVTRAVEALGTVPAVAIEFEEGAQNDEALDAFVREAKSGQARRVAGGIQGVIEELGMPNLVQMLGSTSRQGTLVVRSGAEEGVLAFADGMLRYVRVGTLRAGKALARMLAWEAGHFEFHGAVDALSAEDEPRPIAAAVLDAMRALDEARSPGGMALPPERCFRIDRKALAAESGLTKSEEAVLDLAAAGFTVRRILDVVPEPDAEVMAALRALLERGVLVPKPEA